MKTKFSGILTLLLAFVVQLTFAQEKTIFAAPSGRERRRPLQQLARKGKAVTGEPRARQNDCAAEDYGDNAGRRPTFDVRDQ